jgi:hypothetical protein
MDADRFLVALRPAATPASATTTAATQVSIPAIDFNRYVWNKTSLGIVDSIACFSYNCPTTGSVYDADGAAV